MSIKFDNNQLSYYAYNPTGSLINQTGVALSFTSAHNVTVTGATNYSVELRDRTLTWADSRTQSAAPDPYVISVLSFTATGSEIIKRNSTEVSGTGGCVLGDGRNGGMSYCVNRGATTTTSVLLNTDVATFDFDVINSYSRLIGVLYK